jgi:hypothetical protein
VPVAHRLHRPEGCEFPERSLTLGIGIGCYSRKLDDLAHRCNKRIEHVYFPAGGIASVVANGPHTLEIGIIGRDGMTGVALVMGIDERPRHETYTATSTGWQKQAINGVGM